MNVKLISYSQPVEGLEELKDIQEVVAYCARVSNPDNQINSETSEKLLKYLIREKHWSPFEMVSVCMEIETTRDIARQILRHRSFSFQEFSQRYADPNDALGWQQREARLQDFKNRQNSIETDDNNLQQKWLGQQDLVKLQAVKAYTWALEMGIAKEQARAVLPEGLMQSRIYMNGTLRSWIHYIDLRSSNGTQKEHREIARACADEIVKIFPMAKSYLAPPPS
ncbi:MAG: FAD-dependent thymidylate synthase [Flavobacteriaceae bacterium]|jgi:thymidylate synthase (FAD)